LPGPIETNQEGHSSFGFGRRICVGKHLANDSLFIRTARILWAATLECAKDENGKDIIPDTDAFVEAGVIMWVLRPAERFETSVTSYIAALLRTIAGFRRVSPKWGLFLRRRRRALKVKRFRLFSQEGRCTS
jgi:hypothetical protein